MVLEALRRLQREYDASIKQPSTRTSGTVAQHEAVNSDESIDEPESTKMATMTTTAGKSTGGPAYMRPKKARVSVVQQAIRATIHMLTFAVAYFIMLLAMYYNGEWNIRQF